MVTPAAGRKVPETIKRYRADGGDHHVINPREFPGQPDGGHLHDPKLADHDLIHHAEGRLEHGLKRHGNGQSADGTEKRLLF